MKFLPIAVAVVAFVIAGLYGAGLLQLGAHTPGPHFKHAAVFAVLGVLALVWLRFQSNESGASR
jgi:hypothetical protein